MTEKWLSLRHYYIPQSSDGNQHSNELEGDCFNPPLLSDYCDYIDCRIGECTSEVAAPDDRMIVHSPRFRKRLMILSDQGSMGIKHWVTRISVAIFTPKRFYAAR